jgi:hypothetical protein
MRFPSIMLQPFAERFVKDGNVYDPRKRSKFTLEEKEALKLQNPSLTANQLYDFTKNAYRDHPTELAFRKYICVNADALVNMPAPVCEFGAKLEAEEEFDVVKKRRLIEEATARGDGGSDDDSPEALANFEEFEAATLSALQEIHDDEALNHSRESIELEEAGNVYSTTGGVYFAATDALPGYIKIGCTRRHDPMIRLGELSRYVPIPFKLLHWIPTSLPFSLEAKIHKFFAAKRIRNKGAGTEFFAMSAAAIQTLPPSMMQDTKPSVGRPQIRRHLQRIGFGRRPCAAARGKRLIAEA